MACNCGGPRPGQTLHYVELPDGTTIRYASEAEATARATQLGGTYKPQTT